MKNRSPRKPRQTSLETLESRLLLSTTNPAIFNITDTVAPGQVVGIQGGNFGAHAEVWLDRIVDGNDTPNLETNISANILTKSDVFIAVEIPPGVQEGLWALFVRDPNTEAVSAPRWVNQASVMQTLDLAGQQISPGFTFRLYGRTLDYTSTTSTVRFRDVTTGTFLNATVTQGTDPYTLTVTAPAGLDHENGRQYDLYVSNGYGGSYGEIVGPRLTAIPGGTDYFGVGTPWAASHFGPSIYNNVYNVKTQYGATGNGTTDDRAAIQNAINAANAAGGGVVYLPTGQYNIGTSGLTLAGVNNVVIRGQGKEGVSQSRIFSTTGSGSLLSGKAGNNIGVTDVALESVGAGSFGSLWNVDGAGSNYYFFQRVRFYSDHGSVFNRGASLMIVENSDIIQNTIDGAAVIDINGRYYTAFKNNVIKWGDGRIQLLNTHYLQFEGNHASRSIYNNMSAPQYGGPSIGGGEFVAILDNVFDRQPDPSDDPLDPRNDTRLPQSNDGETLLNENIDSSKDLGIATANTDDFKLKDTTANWATNVYRNVDVTIVQGPGIGQTRRIVSNTSNELVVDRPWDITPTTGSSYSVNTFDSNYMIKGNTLQDVPRGIWILYAGSMDNIVVANNDLLDGQAIYLRGDARANEHRFNVQKNVTVEGNLLDSTYRGWYPASILVEQNNVNSGPNPGNPFYDVVVRGNTINASTPNIGPNDVGISEGYFARGVSNVDDDTAGVLGVIFDSNTANNLVNPYTVNTSAYQTVIWNSINNGAQQVLLDKTMTGGAHASVGTVLGWTANAATPPHVSVTAIDTAASESGQDPAVFRITRSGTSGALVVNYALTGATTAADYVETLSGSVTIADGQSYVDVTVTPVDDLAYFEDTESLTLSLSQDASYLIGNPNASVAIADNDNTTKILDIDYNGTGSGTGGGSDLVTSGGTATLNIPSNPANTAGIVSTPVFDPVLNGGNFMNMNLTTLNGSAPLITVTPTSPANSWAALTTKPGSQWQLNGGFDFFYRRNNNAGSYRIFDVNNATGSSADGGWEPILVLTGAAMNLTINTGSGGTNFSQSQATTFAVGQVYHVGVTFNTDPSTGVVTINYYKKAGTGAIDTTSAVDRIASYSTWNPSEAVVTNTMKSTAWNLGILPAYWSTANVDMDSFRLYSADPRTFGDIVNDTTVSVSAADGAEGGSAGVFTLTRTNASGPLTVNYSLAGTAGAADYGVSGTPGTATFADGQLTTTVTITPSNDTIYEGNETVQMSLVTNPYYVIGSGPATMTLADNDTFNTTVTVSATDSAASETGANNGVFTIARTGTSGALTVNYTVAGTAANGTDYTTLTGTATIANGSSSTTVTVTPTNDGDIELGETVILTLANGVGYALGGSSSATVNLASEDVPTVSVSTVLANAAEATNDLGKWVFTRSGTGLLTQGDLTINYTMAGTAANGTDYVLPGSVVIPDGQTSVTLYLAPVRDNNIEAAETAILTISSNAAYTVGSPSSGTITIAHDVPTITITATDASASEVGPDAATFVVTRTGTGLLTQGAVTVNYVGGGKAANGADYVVSGSVVIPDGAASANITLTPIDDQLLEDTESGSLNLVESGNYIVDPFVNSAAFTIGDNEAWTNADIGTGQVAGGWSYDPAINLYTLKGAGDITGPADTFNYLYQPFKGDGEIIVHVAGNQNGSGGYSKAGIMIRESTSAGSPYAAAYSLGNSNGVEFRYRATAGTASSGAGDTNPAYDVPQWIKLVRAGNVFSAFRSADGVAWTQIWVNRTVALSTGPILVGLFTASHDDADSVTTTFDHFQVHYAQDNFETGNGNGGSGAWVGNWTLAGAASVVNTGAPNGGAYHLQLTGNTGVASRVVDLSDNFPGNSYLQFSYKAAGFEAGETATVEVFDGAWHTLLTVADGQDDNAYRPVSLSLAGLNLGTATQIRVKSNMSDATDVFYVDDLKIVGTDSVMPAVTITATDPNASEAGLDTGSFTVTRSGSTSGALTVKYAVSGNASANNDYVQLTGSVVIPDGQSSAVITVTPLQDSTTEGVETISVNLVAASGYTVSASSAASVVIADDDTPRFTVAVTDSAASEAGGPNTGSYTITRIGNLTTAVTVNYAMSGTAANGSDYSLPGTVSFAANQASAVVTLTPTDDAAIELPETAILTLTAGAGYTVGTPSSATVNISDNDTVVTIAATDSAASESGPDTGAFTISRNGTVGAMTVSYTRSGTATNGTDYTSIPLTAVIPDGASSVTVTVTPVDDATSESTETVILTLTTSTGSGYVLGSPSSATVNITDNDSGSPVVTIAATDASASEAGGDTGVFTVTRAGSTAAAITVNYTITGTAANGTDYTTISNSIVLGIGQASGTITVTPANDSDIENSETVILTLGAGSGYSVGSPSAATVNIASEDLPSVAITATDASASETSPDTGTYTVTRSGTGLVTQGALTVNYTITGTAANGADYTTLGGSVVIADGQASATITLTPTDDGAIEGDETAILTLAGGTGYTIGSPSAATVTIADNDLPAVTITASDASASETGPDNGQFTVTRTGTTGNLTVNYTLTGTAGVADYSQTLTGSVMISNGSSSAVIDITPTDDLQVEGSETLVLTLASGSGYAIGSPNAATVTIADNDSTWTVQDIGNVSLSNITSISSGTYTIQTSGAGIDNTADSFTYLWQRMNGDGEIVARVSGITAASVWSRVGVMMREATTQGSKYAASLITKSQGTVWQRRGTTDGDDSVTSSSGILPPQWLRLVRSGTSFTAYRSADGVTWTQTGTTTGVSMGSTIYVGIAASAHQNVSRSTFVVDNVKVTYASDGLETGNTTGGLGWAGGWSLGGNASVVNTGTPNSGTYHLQLTSNTGVATRTLDLSDAPSARLQFNYKAVGFSGADNATIEVYDGTWHTVQTIATADGAYHFADIDLSPYNLTSSFQIRIKSNMDNVSDQFFIDDLAFVQPG